MSLIKTTLKDYCLSILSENDNSFMQIDPTTVSKVISTNYSKKGNYIKLNILTTYGKEVTLVTEYSPFENWFNSNKDKYGQMFVGSCLKDWVKYFLENSKEMEQVNEEFMNVSMAGAGYSQKPNTEWKEDLSEIIDDDGNIMDSSDEPSNATNTMVGANITKDTSWVYRHMIPVSLRFLGGIGNSIGMGSVVW